MRLFKSISWRYSAIKNIATTRNLYKLQISKIIGAILNWKITYPLPIATKLAEKTDFTLYGINDIGIWWPNEIPPAELPNLYDQVFNPNQFHFYNIDELKIMPNDWVIDAGTCEGFYVHYALKHGANVLALEPVERLVTALNMTFEKEISGGQVILLRALLGEEHSEKTLLVDLENIFLSGVNAHGIPETCTQYTIDEILDNQIIPKVDFIKMDIEGSEPVALNGARNTIKKYKPKLAICVYHEFNHAIDLKNLVLSIRPDYKIKYGGAKVWHWHDCSIRPFIMYCY